MAVWDSTVDCDQNLVRSPPNETELSAGPPRPVNYGELTQTTCPERSRMDRKLFHKIKRGLHNGQRACSVGPLWWANTFGVRCIVWFGLWFTWHQKIR